MNDKIRKHIERRRVQILVHSYIYYALDRNIVSDQQWSQWGVELEELQARYPEEGVRAKYYEEFRDFDHSTGADLDYNKPEIVTWARLLLGNALEGIPIAIGYLCGDDTILKEEPNESC